LILAVLALAWEDKVDQKLLVKLQADATVTANYLILLKQETLNTENVLPLDRPEYVFKTLSSQATESQAGLIAYLQQQGLPYKSYWVANVIVTTTNITHLSEIANRDEVQLIEENTRFRVPLEDIPETMENDTLKRQTGVEWNINWVKAPQVWSRGFRGEGFVVANADTGVQWNHPALVNQYRGSVGTVNHNHNWWDAVHETGSSCGADTRAPCDDNGHGTHTTGTAVGWDGGTNYIGVAPRAQWIACRNMNAGFGTPQTYIECLQFFIAPTDLDGNNPDTSKAPHVIGNSYGCTTQEGCNTASLTQTIHAVLAAGIFMSVSAGNSGPSCNSIREPPATDLGICSVGALGLNSDTVASYSSRGPIGTRVAPNIAAPGSSVRSSYPSNRYASLSGTSMASPAVTGAIPLIWQAKPSLVRRVAETLAVIQSSAVPLSSTACSSSGIPNNVYGYGKLDVHKAAQ